jgi:asparagine synthase (glutamine-hydrolysing)
MTAAKQALASEMGAHIIIDGGGGDNLFCYLQSAAPVADRLLSEGLGRGIWRSASDVAKLTESSMLAVLAKAVQRTWLRPPAYRWSCDERFLTAFALERAGPPRNRWLETPRGALPGSAAHIAIMAVVENLLETSDAQIPERSPLMAQPLVELCLSVPTWLWFDRGHNRALARQAFADRLPAEIVWRRSKGTPDGFVARLYETRRAELRALLCDGRLAGEGLLDTASIDRTLRRPGPVKGHDHIRLLRIADVEAWVRSL